MKSLFRAFLLAFGVVPLLSASLYGETVPDREGAVRRDKAVMEQDARWIYNDVARGFTEARQSGKPLLVVLRCVPCLACSGIDAQVLLQQSELSPLLEQFVCVRVINANALDLSLFQFDYDLSFSTMFFNGDGTVYGRYGSWTHQKNSQERTTLGYRRALEGVLEIHRGYPTNKASLTGKQGKPMPYRTPLQIPTMEGKYRLDLDWNGKVVPSCVHCHQIGDALRLGHRNRQEPMPIELVYPWPAPEVLGLVVTEGAALRIEQVTAGSVAEKAGLRAEDEIVSVQGQPMISLADISWVLHQMTSAGTLNMVVRRQGTERRHALHLPLEWRRKSDIARRVGTWPLRMMVTGGLVLQELTEATRQQRQLPADGLALEVTMVGQYGKHAAGKNAGFRKGDVIVEADGQTARMSESELIGYLLKRRPKGERAKMTVLRGTERLILELPMQ